MADPVESFAGAVLAGGESRRMGTDKALLIVDGRPLILRSVGALLDAGAGSVVVVGGERERLAALGLRMVDDLHPKEGPLGGVITALAACDAPVVVTLACDLMAIDGPTVRLVLDRLDAAPEALGAVPVVDGVEQWHMVAWRASARPPLEAAFTAGARSLRRAAGPLALVSVGGIDATRLADADTPADLA